MARLLESESQRAVTARALRAIGLTRALGLHFYSHFIGVSGRAIEEGQITLALDEDALHPGQGRVSVTAVATLADLALGSAVRTRLAPGARLGTATLSVQLPCDATHGPFEATATVTRVDLTQGHGLARCDITDSERRVVASAHGWFATLPVPPDLTLGPLPWERLDLPEVQSPTIADLDEQERYLLARAEVAGRRAQEQATPVADALLAFTWSAPIASSVRGELHIGPEIANRVGNIQGGALFGAAAIAAQHLLADVPGARLMDGTYHYLRPADGRTLMADARLLRRSGRAAFVAVTLSVDNVPVGEGLFGFRLERQNR